MSQIEHEDELSREFGGPHHFSTIDRRNFFKYMGLFSSMTFLSNCSKPAQHILPMPREFAEYAQRDYEFYTTSFNARGFCQGVRVKCYQGRPIKVEGNAFHPYSLGTTTPQAQSMLYDLYHPGRVQKITWKGKKITPKELSQKIQELMEDWKEGEGVAFIYPPDHSPSLNETILAIQKKFPQSVWSSFSKGKKESWTTYDTEAPDLIASFDEDVFYQRPDALRLARGFMARRKKAILKNSPGTLNKLLVYESSPTLAGAKADERWTLSRAEIWNDAVDLKLLLEGKTVKNVRMSKLVQELKDKQSLVFINEDLDGDAPDLERRINHLLKVPSQSFTFKLPDTHSKVEVERLLSEGKIQTLFFLGTDPLYQEPEWEQKIKKVPLKIALSLYPSETLEASDVRIPRSHDLEVWGDLLAPDGTVTVQQPMIRPLYDSLSNWEFLKLVAQDKKVPLESLRETYASSWDESLQKGVVPLPHPLPHMALTTKEFTWHPLSAGLKIKLIPDPSVGYGEYANNPLLQELPKLFSKVTWQSVFYISPENAKEKDLKNGDVIKVKARGEELSGPVWVLSGVASQTVVALQGYGHRSGTFVAKKRGFNANRFRQDEEVEIKKTSRKMNLASTQMFQKIEEKHSPVKVGSFPVGKRKEEKKLASFYPGNPLPKQQEGARQWGMTIDLTACIGCQACVSACQVENNVPFVGEEQVAKDRILHWLRIDTYEITGRTYFQPVPCMHCEKAPCEVVCPVNATVHGKGGLNEMLYQRCVGTRYCSNNCPYKVRRFNFKIYSNIKRPWNMGFNPEVSVRERGVMEKCTYCIQRIKESEPTGKTPATACQAVCPTHAIVFGDILDAQAEVTRLKQTNLNYDLLEEEGTIPRTSYLKVIRHE